jgi:hypothetical protein
MIYLSPGSSIQVQCKPLPLGVVTRAQQVEWNTSDSSVAVALLNANDPTGRTATLTAAKNAKPDAAADVTWRYKNVNGEGAVSKLLTVRVVRPMSVDNAVTGGELSALGESTEAQEAKAAPVTVHK